MGIEPATSISAAKHPTDKVSPAAVIVGFFKVKGGSKINFNSSY